MLHHIVRRRGAFKCCWLNNKLVIYIALDGWFGKSGYSSVQSTLFWEAPRDKIHAFFFLLKCLNMLKLNFAEVPM